MPGVSNPCMRRRCAVLCCTALSGQQVLHNPSRCMWAGHGRPKDPTPLLLQPPPSCHARSLPVIPSRPLQKAAGICGVYKVDEPHDKRTEHKAFHNRCEVRRNKRDGVGWGGKGGKFGHMCGVRSAVQCGWLVPPQPSPK